MPRRHSSPARDRHAGPIAGARVDVELVREPARTRETEAEPVAARVPVLHGELDVRDSGTLVLEREAQPAARAFGDGVEPDGSAAAVLQRVARELARGGHDFRLVDEVETDLHGALAN